MIVPATVLATLVTVAVAVAAAAAVAVAVAIVGAAVVAVAVVAVTAPATQVQQLCIERQQEPGKLCRRIISLVTRPPSLTLTKAVGML